MILSASVPFIIGRNYIEPMGGVRDYSTILDKPAVVHGPDRPFVHHPNNCT